MKEEVTKVYALVAKVEDHLIELRPALHGAGLAILLANYLARHEPGIREDLLTDHIASVRRMIPICEEENAKKVDQVGHA